MSDLFDANDLVENIPEFSVSDLSVAIKRSIEGEFSHVRVKGEIGRVSKPASGHLYLDIKDEKSVLAGIIWKGTAQNLKVPPEEGLEVIVTGRITTFPGQSRYQIIIEHLAPAGLGSLMLLLEKRKQKLSDEGLFLDSRKKPLPLIPNSIGVITSPSGAVLKDILHRLRDRFPRHVLLWPVTVQGDKCSVEVALAIKKFNEISDGGAVPRPDLLIVARGGGSIEDLWGFNEENVVRAVSESRIPIISAIGHETDITLLDYVADRRAPTPSAAAEMAVPVRNELNATLNSLDQRRTRQISILFERQKLKIRELERLMPKIDTFVSERHQYLDLITGKLESAIKNFVNQKKLNYLRSGVETLQPKILQRDVHRKKEETEALSDRLSFAIKVIMQNYKNKLLELGRLCESLSYRKTLERGYVIVRDDNQKIVDNSKGAINSNHLILEFKDDRLSAKVKTE